VESPPGPARCPEREKNEATEEGKAMSRHVVPARPAGDRYLTLVRKFPLRPLRTEEENDQAIQVISSLGSRALDPDGRDYLAVLIRLIEDFEEKQYPMPRVHGRAMMRHLIESRGMTQAVVASETGIAESALSEMLAGKRQMAVKHVKALARYFGVTVDVIIGD
jgi:HTH-type transcriptional regulator/antitoxin HigA